MKLFRGPFIVFGYSIYTVIGLKNYDDIKNYMQGLDVPALSNSRIYTVLNSRFLQALLLHFKQYLYAFLFIFEVKSIGFQ